MFILLTVASLYFSLSLWIKDNVIYLTYYLTLYLMIFFLNQVPCGLWLRIWKSMPWNQRVSGNDHMFVVLHLRIIPYHPIIFIFMLYKHLNFALMLFIYNYFYFWSYCPCRHYIVVHFIVVVIVIVIIIITSTTKSLIISLKFLREQILNWLFTS